MINRTTRLDLLIYEDVRNLNPGENISLEYEGFALPEVDMRLKYLANKGLIQIDASGEEVVVTGVTNTGHDFFKSL